MDSRVPEATSTSTARRRKRLTNRVIESLRDLNVQLTLLNHQVGAHVDLRDADLECLDLVSRYGPMGPTALARRAGLHPATLTGVLDRLERGGWVVRTPNPSDRRAILVQVIKEREAEIAYLFSGLYHAMDDVCAEYEEAELAMITDFLLRTAKAGRIATDTLTEG